MIERVKLWIEIAYCRWSQICNRRWQRALKTGGFEDLQADNLRLLRLEDQALEAQLIMARSKLEKL